MDGHKPYPVELGENGTRAYQPGDVIDVEFNDERQAFVVTNVSSGENGNRHERRKAAALRRRRGWI